MSRFGIGQSPSDHYVVVEPIGGDGLFFPEQESSGPLRDRGTIIQASVPKAPSVTELGREEATTT